MTTPDLKAIEERLAAATPGPWDAWLNQVRVAAHRSSVASCAAKNGPEDATFIASAPTDIAALIAEVRRLRRGEAEIDAMAGRGLVAYADVEEGGRISQYGICHSVDDMPPASRWDRRTVCRFRAPPPVATHRFPNVSCSQCGNDFGPGDSGFSHCHDHAEKEIRR
jgi:hypothetical protein